MVQDLFLKISEPLKHIIQSELEAAKTSLADLDIKIEEDYQLPSRIHLCQLNDRDVRENKVISYFTYSEVEASLQVDKKNLKITLKSESLLDALNVENIVDNCKSRTTLAKFSSAISDEKIRQFNSIASKGREFLLRVTFRNIVLRRNEKEMVPEITGLDQICFNKQDPELPPLKGVGTPMLQPSPSAIRTEEEDNGGRGVPPEDAATAEAGGTPVARDQSGNHQSIRRTLSNQEGNANQGQGSGTGGQEQHLEYVRNHPDLSRCTTTLPDVEGSDIQSIPEEDGSVEMETPEERSTGVTYAPRKNHNKRPRGSRGRGYGRALGRHFSGIATIQTTSEDESVHQYYPRNKQHRQKEKSTNPSANNNDNERVKELEGELKSSKDELNNLKKIVDRMADQQREQEERRVAMQALIDRLTSNEMERINNMVNENRANIVQSQQFQSRVSNQTEFLSLNDTESPSARPPPSGFAQNTAKTPFSGTSTAKAISTPADNLGKTISVPDESIISSNPFDPNYVEPIMPAVSAEEARLRDKVLDRSRRGKNNVFQSTDSSGEDEIFFMNPQHIDFDAEIEPVVVMLDGNDKAMQDAIDLITEWAKKFDNHDQLITPRVNDSIMALMVKLAQEHQKDTRSEETRDNIYGLGKLLFKKWRLNETKLKRTLTKQKQSEIEKSIRECKEAGFEDGSGTPTSNKASNEENNSNDTVVESEKSKDSTKEKPSQT